jgi:hypothetical protein
VACAGLQALSEKETTTMNITTRDFPIINEALATAISALEQLPDDRQPWSNIRDMRRLLASRVHEDGVPFYVGLAQCSLGLRSFTELVQH